MRSDVDRAIELIWSLRGEERREAWRKLLSQTPKTVYSELSQRQIKTLQDQSRTHGLPIGKERIDLGAVLKKFHDILKELASSGGGGLNSVAKQRKLDQENEVLELRRIALEYDLKKKQGRFVEREEVRRRVEIVRQWINSLGEWLGKRYGADIQRDLNDRLEELAEEFESGRLTFDESTTTETAGKPA